MASDSYTRMSLRFEDYTLKLDYQLDERYPSAVEQVVERKKGAFKEKEKERAGLAADRIQLFRKKALDKVLEALF